MSHSKETLASFGRSYSASVHDVGAATSFGIALHSLFDFLVATVRSSADLVPLPGSSLIPNRSQGNGQNCTARYR